VPFADTLAETLRRREKRPALGLPPDIVDPTPAAVLIPLFERDGEPHLVFTRRTDQVRDHKGQISFPGGARDPKDATPCETALREAEEEIGLSRAAVRVLGELDEYPTSTGYLITPVVGLIPAGYPYRPHPAEVAEVIEVPLAVLRNPARHRTGTMLWRGQEKIVHHFDAGSCVVWGVTARILLSFFEVLDLAFRAQASPDTMPA
jgi:8-oxo-dGTP pyrophosphatase MutT (NUDIX family)